MAAHLGTWVYSDTIKSVTVTVESPDGTAFNLTSYTPKIEVKRVGAASLAATVTGSVVSAAAGTCKFYLGNTAALQPSAVGEVWQYEAMVRLEHSNLTDVAYAGSGVDGGSPFTFSVRRWV